MKTGTEVGVDVGRSSAGVAVKVGTEVGVDVGRSSASVAVKVNTKVGVKVGVKVARGTGVRVGKSPVQPSPPTTKVTGTDQFKPRGMEVKRKSK